MKRTPKPAALQPHYSTSDAARFVGCTAGHLRNLRVQNKGPRWTVTADGTIRYPESALIEYLAGAKGAAA